MKTKKPVRVSYDADADVMSFENTTRTAIDYAREMGNLVVHFSKKDEPVLIEVLQASRAFRGKSSVLTRIADSVTS